MDLSGRTALVTGAARRIGKAIALSLATAGADVVVHYRTSEDAAREVVEGIRALGRRVQSIRADLQDDDAIKNLVFDASAITGRLDVLINSASIFETARLEDARLEEFRRHFHLNALAPFALARDFFRHLKEQGHEGVIVNLLDTRITDYDKHHVAYAVSKRALHTFTQMMAVEFAPLVRVNAVAPGLILPPAGEDDSYLERLRKTNPLETYGTLDEVTDAVLFLAGNRFVTGQTIWVDGGRHLKGSFYGA